MSERQSEQTRASWAGVEPEERRRRTSPAVAKSVARRQRAFKLMSAFEDALEASGLVLVPADGEGGEQ